MELDKDAQIRLAALKALEAEVDLTTAQQIDLGGSSEYIRKNYDSQAAHKAFHEKSFIVHRPLPKINMALDAPPIIRPRQITLIQSTMSMSVGRIIHF